MPSVGGLALICRAIHGVDLGAIQAAEESFFALQPHSCCGVE